VTDVLAAAAMVAAAALHLYVFARESLLFSRPSTQRMFEVEALQATAVRLWAYHQGIYNALLGGVAAAGAVALLLGDRTVGATLTIASGVSMIIAAATLVMADRRPSRIPGLLTQAVPPAAGLLLLLA
jgi:putative membrane protein